MKIRLTVAPPSAPITGIAPAAILSETTVPNRDAISETKLLTTGADAVATPRCVRKVEASFVNLLNSARDA